MIKITNLYKTFDQKRVLENLNCTIQTGSIYGLIGANGAGKSTLLRIINDIYRRDSGHILIDDVEVENNEEVKQKLAFLSDDYYIMPGYTLKDLAEYYQAMYQKFDMEYLKDLASKLKLDLNTKLDTLSKGLKRQCAIICVLSTKAEYIFFDETFDGLDPVIRNVMKKIISQHMSDFGTTIVLTSHNLRELEDICDNLGVLYKGGVLFESEIDSLKTNMLKVQISLKGDFDKDSFDNIDILSFKKSGSVATIILKGEREEIEEKLRAKDPIILDFLTLTLEEIFIYEMEVIGYEFKDIV